MLSEKEFINRVGDLPKTIPSKTRKASYSGFRINGKDLHFHRVNPKTNWYLDLDELYQIYTTNRFINTSVIKKTTGKRVNSPSVAVLMAIKCIDHEGNRIN